MKLRLMAAKTATKAINKARVTGRLSLIAVTKLNLFAYYITFVKEQLDAGKVEYQDKYKQLVSKYNNLANSCPDIICNIREADCSSGQYEFTGNINNPYNPVAPITPIDPEPEINLPPTIDDNTITVENDVTTVLGIEMFTSKYSDPEGDILEAIKINKIYPNNLGLFYVDGVLLQEDQIITRGQLEAESFIHVGSEITTFQKDGFEFSVRNSINTEWIN